MVTKTSPPGLGSSPKSPKPKPKEKKPDSVEGVSIVVPAYNEERAIKSVLAGIGEILKGGSLTFEILVVDDGSRDGTAAAVANLGYPVRGVRHDINRGYGAALKTGIREARYDLVCITDADGTYPNERIPDLIESQVSGDNHMTVGARTGANAAIPLVRKPAKWALGKLANYIVGGEIPDINSGLRVFRKEDALMMFPILPDGFSFTTTITLAMWTNGFEVSYLPIAYHPRIGVSKIRPIHDTLNFIQLILKMGLYFAPMKIFLPLSGGLFAAGFLWALYSHFILGRLADVSTLVITMTAVQVAGLGLVAELINRRFPSVYRKD